MRSRYPAASVGPALALVLALLLGPAGATATDAAASPSPATCEPGVEMGVVEPPDARGTTFVGTYRGDAIGGADDARALTTAWNVERVYAGGPLPRDLVFQTPACGWTNLTPGVRYLFSTSATDLAWGSPDAGQPSVNDSLAWELLPDDSVRLAPFDTHAAADYSSEELLAITTFEDALWSVAPDGGQGSPPADPQAPDFGCLASWFTAAPEEARGLTFSGLYVGDQSLPGPRTDDVRTFWALDRVFAGGPLPEVLTMRSDGCAPTRLEAGHRYLFSTADALEPSTLNSLAWELADDGSVRLAPFGSLEPGDYAGTVTAIATLDDALAAVAPGASAGETPERAGDRTPG